MSRGRSKQNGKSHAEAVKKARNEGSVPRSAELTKAIVLLAGVVAMRYMGEYYYKHFTEIFNWFFVEGITQTLDPQTVYRMFVWSLTKMALLVLPLMLIIAAVAYSVLRLQVGDLWIFKFRWDRVNFNIMRGIKQLMVSIDTLVRLGRSVGQAAVVAVAPYLVIKQELPNLLPLFHQNVMGISSYMLLVAYKMICYALVPMLLIAIADLWWTRYRYDDNLMMTKEEVKDERRQAEGDPVIKQKQLRKMYEVMARRLRGHGAQGRRGHHQPPPTTPWPCATTCPRPRPPWSWPRAWTAWPCRFVKSQWKNDVPIHENPPLAQALYKQVEVGEAIPEEMYQAVAAILAKLAKFKHRRA